MGRARKEFRKENHKFHFDANWCFKKSCEEEIKYRWAFYSKEISVKLEKLGGKLQRWSRHIKMELVVGRMKLEERLRELYDLDLDDDVLIEITNFHLGINLKEDKVKLFWEQRAHVNFLKIGNHNTNFFHKVRVGQQHRNQIHGLENEDGCWVINGEDMLWVALEVFREAIHCIRSK
ncbi:hypothetical protein J1N35_011649 [Gossypium stocksii]|uniref:Uncharacterized protein n=1 Tax=Gossypium stocksii TaxID=47602 RepID=A0A9D4ADS7_9ROSI|nr:hypothetical protein J1N35_011649 [Gossypium stocksii]